MNKENKDRYYSKMLIYRRLRLGLWITIAMVGIVFAWLLFHNMTQENHWAILTVPILTLGCALIFFPRSEVWFYEPWQTKPQQYERNFVD